MSRGNAEVNSGSTMDPTPQIPEAQAAQIREFVFAGRKIQAIKLLRESTPGLGLAEAKTVIEKLEAELRQTSREKFTGKSGGCGARAALFFIALLILLMAAHAWAASRAGTYLKKDDAWFAGDEGRRIAANILSWQAEAGDWPKNTDTATVPYSGEPAKLKGTFDNGATCDEIRFLGRAFLATRDEKCRDAAINGLDHILLAQYGNGGWPQTFPPGNGYPRYITFNDDAMVRLMNFVREISREERWIFVGEERRRKAGEAFEKGVQCILQCQIRDTKSGKLAVWCAQHDEKDFSPRPARSYELPSFSGSESVGVLRLLMSIEKPRPEIVAAVEGAVEWIKHSRIAGIKVVEVPDEKAPKGKDKRVVEDADGPGLWARFYEIDSGRPFFCDRDGVKKYSLAEIGYERRNGYAWYGNWGEELLREYPQWKRKIESQN
jgi:PelA/Pel-15E family pectate lyase